MRLGRMQSAGRLPGAAPTTPPPSEDRPPPLSRTTWSAAARDSVASHTKDRHAYLNRLRRIEGQIRGLQRMVDQYQYQYPIDVLTQVSATTKALQSFALALLEEHMATCVVDAAADQPDADAKVKEAADAIARLVRS
jgi:DNA-binding FrmR family transcriptional regulator